MTLLPFSRCRPSSVIVGIIGYIAPIFAFCIVNNVEKVQVLS